ncbi:unnamed protein product [Didymodactylos carnosus]|uniref:Transforming acidic coiled-coil-containing protein C-terminal domain-containing protein n=1 Tax=Didymodactylos carnosus TaxID=1234261 RepID=A0A814SNC3_9BILA|nr:unnamed protein product [Didymodactylos carnosus]CAF1149746.1 unnamed protein product [Didymodactylos carnosus]CAF3872869.1 unnamed protein product [Didymodactylos carnosus]CAF3913218.1 unnamed protein product [Didymodactylos carnosus]
MAAAATAAATTPVVSDSDTSKFILDEVFIRPPPLIPKDSLDAVLPSIDDEHDQHTYPITKAQTSSMMDFLANEEEILKQNMQQSSSIHENMIKSIVKDNDMNKSTLFRSLIEHNELENVHVDEKKRRSLLLSEHFEKNESSSSSSNVLNSLQSVFDVLKDLRTTGTVENKIQQKQFNPIENKLPTIPLTNDHINSFRDCLENYYRTLWSVCAHTEELRRELRTVKSERDQLTEDLVNVENAYADLRKRNEKLKLNITEHKKNVETLKQFSEDSIRYNEEQKQKYQVLKQHAQEKLDKANEEIEKLRKIHTTESESVQAQLRYAQLRVQSLEQELQSTKQELQQKKKENTELTNICDELLATSRR